MPDAVCLVRLPDRDQAPAYRESLSIQSHFTVDDLGNEIVCVKPAEGAGATHEYFAVHQLCDASTNLADPATWTPLRQAPPYKQLPADDAQRYRDANNRLAAEVINRQPQTDENQLYALGLVALGAAEMGETVEALQVNLPALFGSFPQGILLYVTVSPVLLARLAFARVQLATQLTPDLRLGEGQLGAFSELTLSRGGDTAALATLPLVALSPGVLGFIIPAIPHALIFCFGGTVDLRRRPPISLPYLFRPRVLSDPEGLGRSAFLSDHTASDGKRLVDWWVGQLNRLYSHVADPTRWTDSRGYHDAPAQTAWLVTLERLMGDTVSLLAEPQAPDLFRAQAAFDLLDKAEALLGYGRRETGRGFKALLRRDACLRRLHDAYSSLPEDIAERLDAEAGRLFDGLYAQVRQNTLQHRLTPGSAKIATGSADKLRNLVNSALVSQLCRAVRNSSHGILDTLRGGDDRFLLAANTDGIPAELAALAPLIALGLLADAEGLVDGTWRRKLVHGR